MASCPPLTDRMLHRQLPELNPVRFHKTSGGGGGLLPSVRWLGEFCPRFRVRLHLQGTEPPSPRIRSSSPIKSFNRKIFSPPQAAATAEATVDEEKFRSLMSSPLMFVPPFSKAEEEEEEDDLNDYFHFFSVAEQKKFRVRKNLGRRWHREYLTPDDTVCIGSSHGWLVCLDPRNSYLYLFNPFIMQNSSSSPSSSYSSHHRHHNLPYIPLPSLETLDFVTGLRVLKSDNLSSSTSLIRNFHMIYSDKSEHNAPPSEIHFHCIKDLVLSSSPWPSSLDNDKCTTAVMNYCGGLYFCKLGDERWTYFNSHLCRSCDDLIYFSKDGRFYALGDEYHQLEAWDLSDHSCPKHAVIDPTFSSPRTIPEMTDYCNSNKVRFVTYLVESLGELLLVIRFFATVSAFREEEEEEEEELEVPEEEEELEDYFQEQMFSRTVRFVVHKLNFNLNKWESLECLNDRALFVGCNHSFSLSTRDYPELRENSIYFTENYEEPAVRHNTSHDNGVFHFQDNSVTFYRTSDWKHIEQHFLARDWEHIEPDFLAAPSPVWVAKIQ